MADPTQQGLGSLVITTLQNGVVAINSLAKIIQSVFPNITGTFTLAAAATTTVAQPSVRATSVISLTPTNAAAATVMGTTKALYVQSITPGTGFVVATGDGTNPAGTPTFAYSVFNPS